MPVSQFLSRPNADLETRRIVGVAFELALLALRVDRSDPAAERIARKIVQVANDGERNPDLVCERTLDDFRQWRQRRSKGERRIGSRQRQNLEEHPLTCPSLLQLPGSWLEPPGSST
jgi:hypothetical protein